MKNFTDVLEAINSIDDLDTMDWSSAPKYRRLPKRVKVSLRTITKSGWTSPKRDPANLLAFVPEIEGENLFVGGAYDYDFDSIVELSMVDPRTRRNTRVLCRVCWVHDTPGEEGVVLKLLRVKKSLQLKVLHYAKRGAWKNFDRQAV
jgi:hypothetical protein